MAGAAGSPARQAEPAVAVTSPRSRLHGSPGSFCSAVGVRGAGHLLSVASLRQAAGLTSAGGRAACGPAKPLLAVPRAPSPAGGRRDWGS